MSNPEPTAFDEVPDPPAYYITIRRSDDDSIEVDVGDLPFEAALGLMTIALAEMNDCRPEVVLRSTSPVFVHDDAHCPVCCAEDAEEEEDE